MKLSLFQACLLALVASGAGAAVVDGAASMAFVSIRTGDAQIYVRDAKGVDQMLTKAAGVHTQPAISVDGRLAYVLQVKGVPTIYTMDADGSNQQRLTQSDRGESSPSWSPDGKAVAFFSMVMDTGVQELHIVDIEQKSTVKLTGPGKDMGPAPASWSADGSRLAILAADVKGKGQVFVVPRDGSGMRDVSSKFAPRGATFANLSPDGNKVVWVPDMRGRLPIIVTDINTGDSTDLTEGQTTGNESPRWSPDGKQIAFASARGGEMDQRNEIYVMDADGKNVRNVSKHPQEDFDPKWSADGHSLVFASLRNGTTQMFKVDLVSGLTRQLSNHNSHDMDHVVRPLAAGH
jgi:TolB protein